MKFKNFNEYGEDCRSLSLTDKAGDTLTVLLFKTKPEVVIIGNGEEAITSVVISRPKALKLAWAIIDELNGVTG